MVMHPVVSSVLFALFYYGQLGLRFRDGGALVAGGQVGQGTASMSPWRCPDNWLPGPAEYVGLMMRVRNCHCPTTPPCPPFQEHGLMISKFAPL
jgi:hypothetical protein